MLRVFVCALLFSNWAYAANDPLGLVNQSEVGYVIVGGNAESESTTIKQKSIYNWLNDSLTFTGRYIQASGEVTTNGVTENITTAENWAANLRYERVITPKWFNAYFAYGWEGDRFQGIREAQIVNVGGKYFTANSKTYQQFFELGYEYNRQLLTTLPAPADRTGVGYPNHPELHLLRIFAQADYKYSKTFSMGAWVEFKPSITNFDEQLINYSPYITSVLTDIFSLKVSYEARYRSKPAVAGNENTDFTFTTALLANF